MTLGGSMMQSDQSIKSMSVLHEHLGCNKPVHPLITKLNYSEMTRDIQTLKADFYAISCTEIPGKSYKFAIYPPENTISIDTGNGGWLLMFHENMVGSEALRQVLENTIGPVYNEKEILVGERAMKDVASINDILAEEYSQNLDIYSNELIRSNLKLLLTKLNRYRQVV